MPIIFVSEVTFPRFFLNALLGKKPRVLGCQAKFPVLSGFLSRVVDLFVASGRASYLVDEFPALHHIREYPVSIYLHDIFGETEQWHENYFQFSMIDSKLPDYATAYKIAAGIFVTPLQLPVLLLDVLSRATDQNEVTVLGVPATITEMYKAYCGAQAVPTRPQGSVSPTAAVFNLAVGTVTALFSVAWIGLRTRPLLSKPESIFLLADAVGARRDLSIFSEVNDVRTVVAVPRAASHHGEDEQRALQNFRRTDANGGRFGILSGLSSAALAVRDIYRIWWWLRHAPPGLFYQACLLPHRRTKIQGILNRFRPEFHWGRDIYNPEHVLRRQELNRIGAQAHGSLSGWGAYAYRVPHGSYVSFDRFYVFGMHMYDAYLKQTWDTNMSVLAVGSAGTTRDDHNRLLNRNPVKKDIVVFTSLVAAFDHPAAKQFIRDLANGLPDRKIFVQVKPPFRNRPNTIKFVQDCLVDRPNIEYTEAHWFEMIKCSEYAISDPSTVVLECLQYGLKSFMLDVLEYHRTCLYRDFPGLCQSSGTEMVQTILEIESGRSDYRQDLYTGLVDLSGRSAVDVILADFGLEQRKQITRRQEADVG